MLDLSERARELTNAPKGILAADESTTSADKRLASYGISTGEPSRRSYRDLFLSAPGIEHYLSGVILFDETLHEKNHDCIPFAKLLLGKGIQPGIKVDQGTELMPGSKDELITNGLIGLPERLVEYEKKFGTTFTKWRAVIKIEGDRLPTSAALVENAKRLALYARMVQEAGMVPMLEPEVLYDGNHSRLRAREVITAAITAVIQACRDHAVDMTGIILKTSMALSGKDTGKRDTPEEVAIDTLDALLASVPREVPGIVFLSGGQDTEQATENLRAISARAKDQGVPWNLTFSYARALQDEALHAWGGKDEHIEEAQAVFLARLQKVSGTLG